MLFFNLCQIYLPPTISPVCWLLLPNPPMMMILSSVELSCLVTTAACSYLSWLKRGLIWQEIWPQCCVVSPFILPTSPRDAVSLGVEPTAHDQLPTVVDDREGVFLSPLGGKVKEGGDVTWCRKRRDWAVGIGIDCERFDACFSSSSPCYYETCKRKSEWNTHFLIRTVFDYWSHG